MTLTELLNELATLAEQYGDTSAVRVVVCQHGKDKAKDIDDIIPHYDRDGNPVLEISFL